MGKKKEPTDLEKKRETKAIVKKSKIETLSDLLKANEAKIQAGAPKYLNTEALIRVALTAVQKNPKLLNCTAGSILQACMDCAVYGLVPNSMTNEAHLIPFKDTCVLVVGYKGLTKLATNTGLVAGVSVRAVHFEDEFEFEYGLDEQLFHIPAEGARGDFRGAYAVVRYKDGQKDFEYVSAIEGEEHRKKFSRAKKDSPWDSNFPAMVMKTALRKALKYIPSSPESERMSLAIAKDEMLEDRGIIDIEPIEKDEIPDPQPKKKEEPNAPYTGNKPMENPEDAEEPPPESEDPSYKPGKAGDPLFEKEETRPHD